MRPDIQPFRQGDLDGLCGVYALINAVRMVEPRPDHYYEAVMGACILVLYRKNESPFFFMQGIGMHEMIHLIQKVMRPNYGVQCRRPFARNAGASLNEYWKACAGFLEKDHRAVLMAFKANNMEHWSVIVSMNDMHINLLDSDGWRAIKRASLTMKKGKTRKPVQIYPAQTFFMSSGKD